MIEGLATSEDDGGDGIVAHHDRQAGFFAQEHVEVFEKRSAAGEDDAFVDDVSGELRGRTFEGDKNGFDDGVDGLAERFSDFVGVDDDGLGDTCDHVAPLTSIGLLLEG